MLVDVICTIMVFRKSTALGDSSQSGLATILILEWEIGYLMLNYQCQMYV